MYKVKYNVDEVNEILNENDSSSSISQEFNLNEFQSSQKSDSSPKNTKNAKSQQQNISKNSNLHKSAHAEHISHKSNGSKETQSNKNAKNNHRDSHSQRQKKKEFDFSSLEQEYMSGQQFGFSFSPQNKDNKNQLNDDFEQEFYQSQIGNKQVKDTQGNHNSNNGNIGNQFEFYNEYSDSEDDQEFEQFAQSMLQNKGNNNSNFQSINDIHQEMPREMATPQSHLAKVKDHDKTLSTIQVRTPNHHQTPQQKISDTLSSSVNSIKKNEKMNNNEDYNVDEIIKEIEQEEELERIQYQRVTQYIVHSQKLYDTNIADISVSSDEDRGQTGRNKKSYEKLRRAKQKEPNLNNTSSDNKNNNQIEEAVGFIQDSEHKGQINPLDIIDADEENMMYKQNQSVKNEAFEKELILHHIQPTQSHKNMYYQVLEQISYTLMSDQQYGSSKVVISVHNKCIAIGTSKSLVLIFDYFNPRNMNVLGEQHSQQEQKILGEVTAMDISYDQGILAVGYEFGEIIFWNTLNYSIIKRINGIHESAILSIKFREKSNDSTISTDNSGNVFLLQIKKMFWNWTHDPQRLLSKSKIYFEIQQFEGQKALKQTTDNSRKSVYSGQKKFNIFNIELIALLSVDHILILSIKPQLKLIHKIQKPPQVRLGSIPQFCFQPLIIYKKYGEPSDQLYKQQYPYFCLAWGSLLRYYRFNENLSYLLEDGSNHGSVIDCVSHTVTEHSCLYLSMLSNKMVLHIDTRKQIALYYTEQFLEGDHEYQKKEDLIIVQKQNQNYVQSVKHKHKMEHNIEYQSVIKDTSNDNQIRSTFNNTISTNPYTNDIYILTDRNVVKGHLNRWSETVNQFIKQTKWNDALKLCSDLYNTKITMFADQPELSTNEGLASFESLISDILKIYLKNSVDQFNECWREGQDVEFMWKQLCIICIEFCLSIQNYKLLFGQVRNCFFNNERNNLFLSCLEYFIVNGKIKEIPSQLFIEVSIFYKDKNKISVLQQFLIGLNISSLDIGFAIPLCLENNLYTPLTYICAKKNNDFITPLYKMYQKHQIEELKNEHAIKQKKKQSLLYICMWFIRNSFNGIIFPNEKIEESQKKIVIRQIIVWIFDQDIHQSFAKVDSAIFLDLMFQLFENVFIKEQLRQYDEHLYSYFLEEITSIQQNYRIDSLSQNRDKNSTTILDKNKKEVFYFPGLLHLAILTRINSVLKQTMITYPEIKTNFAIFIGKICSLPEKLDIDINICIKALKILFNYIPPEFEQKQEEGKTSIMRQNKEHAQHPHLTNQEKIQNLLANQEVPLQFPLATRELLITSILQSQEKKLLQLPDIVELIISELTEAEKEKEKFNEQYDESMAYLLYLEGSYLQAFNLFLLQAQNKNKVVQIFQWLTKAYQSNKKFVTEFKQELIENSRELVTISCQFMKQFVLDFMFDDLQKILDVLSEYPPMLLDFMDTILEEGREKLKLNEEFYLAYISLLSKYYPEKVIEELKKYPKNYNTDSVLELCQLNQAEEPWAYILLQKEIIDDAFDLYLSIFNRKSNKAVQRMKKNKQFDSNIIKNSFDDLINICIINHQKTDNYAENVAYWQKLASKILQKEEKDNFWIEIEKYSYNKVTDSQRKLLLTFSDVIADLFIKMIQYTSVKEVINLVGMFQDSLELKYVKFSLIKVFQEYSHDIRITSISFEMLQDDALDVMQNLIQQSLKGIYFEQYCGKCNIELSDVLIGGNKENVNYYGYKCGHLYHKECQKKKKKYCLKCIKEDTTFIEKLINDKEDSIKKLHGNQNPYNQREALLKQQKSFSDQESSSNVVDDSFTNNSTILDSSNFDTNSNRNLKQGGIDVNQIRANLKEKMIQKLQVFDQINDEYYDQSYNKNNIYVENDCFDFM